jgi:hypothetical protein
MRHSTATTTIKAQHRHHRQRTAPSDWLIPTVQLSLRDVPSLKLPSCHLAGTTWHTTVFGWSTPLLPRTPPLPKHLIRHEAARVKTQVTKRSVPAYPSRTTWRNGLLHPTHATRSGWSPGHPPRLQSVPLLRLDPWPRLKVAHGYIQVIEDRQIKARRHKLCCALQTVCWELPALMLQVLKCSR